MTSSMGSESQGVLSEYVHDVSSYTVVWCQWCAWIIQNETVIFLKIDRKKVYLRDVVEINNNAVN